jgi:hypothetical protein
LSVLRILTSGLVAAALLVGSSAPGQASPLASGGDPHGDVSVAEGVDLPDPALVRSIDLQHVTVTRQRGGVLVVIRLKRVLPLGRLVQSVGLTVVASGPAGPLGIFFVVAPLQHLGSAGAFTLELDDEGSEGGNDAIQEPDVCRVAASKGSKVVRLEIPQRCLPDFAGRLIVSSVLVDKRGGSNPLVATDDLNVRGLVDLQRS